MSATKVRRDPVIPQPVSTRRNDRMRTFVVLAVGVALIVGVERWGRFLQSAGERLFVDSPPLSGSVDPRLPLATIWVLSFALLIIWRGPRLLSNSRWRPTLVLTFAGSAIFASLLALTDGTVGFLGPVTAPSDYLHDVGRIGGLTTFLHGFVANIDTYTTHVRAHPPGMLLTIWGLGKVGFGGPRWIAALEILGGAASVPAVLVVIRELAGGARARAAAPFLIFVPFAAMFGSGDAFFLGVGAWACAALVVATGRLERRRTVWALSGGLLFGAGLMLSYGLLLLALIPAVVIVRRRSIRVALLGLVGAGMVLGTFAVAGFRWWDGLAATRVQYAESIARLRPGNYFLVANIAALAAVVGPATWVGLVRLRERRVWTFAAPALAAIVLADLSGLSKGEVERIWLPFMPWLVAAAAIGLARSDADQPGGDGALRAWLGLQVVWALGIQLIVRSPW